MKNDFADIMKKERVTASKKAKTITKPETVIDHGEDLPICSAVSNVDEINNHECQRSLSTAYSANQRDERFSKSSHQIYGPKTKL